MESLAISLSIDVTLQLLTAMHRIAEWEVRWTVALRLVLVDPAGSVQSATSVLAELSSLADASLVWVSVASRVASALEAVQGFSALGVHAAGSPQALVPS